MELSTILEFRQCWFVLENTEISHLDWHSDARAEDLLESMNQPNVSPEELAQVLWITMVGLGSRGPSILSENSL